MKPNYAVIRKRREEAGFSLSKLAELCRKYGEPHIDTSRLSRCERQQANLNIDQLALIMAILNIKPNEFFTKTETGTNG
jgi:transcriptional regulator with XRE-family HTH domain